MSGLTREEEKIAIFKEVLTTYFRKLKDGERYDFYLFPTPLLIGEKISEYAEVIQVLASLGKTFAFCNFSSVDLAATVPKNRYARELCTFALRNKMVVADDRHDIIDKNISVVVPSKELKDVYITNTGNTNYYTPEDISSISVARLSFQTSSYPFDVKMMRTDNYEERVFSSMEAILWFKTRFGGNEVYLKTAKATGEDEANSSNLLRFSGDWIRFVVISDNSVIGYKFLWFDSELCMVKKAKGNKDMADWMLNYL